MVFLGGHPAKYTSHHIIERNRMYTGRRVLNVALEVASETFTRAKLCPLHGSRLQHKTGLIWLHLISLRLTQYFSFSPLIAIIF